MAGMSGGQINKDAEIVAWVARMNELKEKESPGSTTAGKDDKKAPKKKVLGSEAAKEIEEYRLKLKSEFGYSNKDINADPDMVDMQAKLKAMKKWALTLLGSLSRVVGPLLGSLPGL